MSKKINTKLSKLIKYYNLINYNLIFNNKEIIRYKKKGLASEGTIEKSLNNLSREISEIKGCKLKDNASKQVFSDGNSKSKIMIIERSRS